MREVIGILLLALILIGCSNTPDPTVTAVPDSASYPEDVVHTSEGCYQFVAITEVHNERYEEAGTDGEKYALLLASLRLVDNLYDEHLIHGDPVVSFPASMVQVAQDRQVPGDTIIYWLNETYEACIDWTIDQQAVIELP